jgi:hypothetical protein
MASQKNWGKKTKRIIIPECLVLALGEEPLP